MATSVKNVVAEGMTQNIVGKFTILEFSAQDP